MTDLLVKRGFSVRTAENGVEGVGVWRNE